MTGAAFSIMVAWWRCIARAAIARCPDRRGGRLFVAVVGIVALIGWTVTVQRAAAGLLGSEPLPQHVIGPLAAALVATSAAMCGIATVLMLIWSRRDCALARTVTAHSRYPTLGTLALVLPGVLTGLLVGLIGQLGLLTNLASQVGYGVLRTCLLAASLISLVCWTGWFVADLITPVLTGAKTAAGLFGGLLPALLVLADVALALPNGSTPLLSNWVTKDWIWGFAVGLGCLGLLTVSARELARRPHEPVAALLIAVPSTGPTYLVDTIRELLLGLRHPIVRAGWIMWLMLLGAGGLLVRSGKLEVGASAIAVALLAVACLSAESAVGRSGEWLWLIRVVRGPGGRVPALIAAALTSSAVATALVAVALAVPPAALVGPAFVMTAVALLAGRLVPWSSAAPGAMIVTTATSTLLSAAAVALISRADGTAATVIAHAVVGGSAIAGVRWRFRGLPNRNAGRLGPSR